MSTISVPLPDEMLKSVKSLADLEGGASISTIVRKAIKKYLEDKAVESVLKASEEPSLEGDLDELAKKI